MNSMPELVQSALSALRHLQPADRVTAIAILSMWAHATEIDIERVVHYYFTGTMPESTAQRALAADEDRLGQNADYRDGYVDGYLDCGRVKRQVRRKPRTLNEARNSVIEGAFSSLITVGVLSKADADSLIAQWSHEGELTLADFAALQAAVGISS